MYTYIPQHPEKTHIPPVGYIQGYQDPRLMFQRSCNMNQWFISHGVRPHIYGLWSLNPDPWFTNPLLKLLLLRKRVSLMGYDITHAFEHGGLLAPIIFRCPYAEPLWQEGYHFFTAKTLSRDLRITFILENFGTCLAHSLPQATCKQDTKFFKNK